MFCSLSRRQICSSLLTCLVLKQLGYLEVGFAGLKERGKSELECNMKQSKSDNETVNLTIVVMYLQRTPSVLLYLLHWHSNSKSNYTVLRVYYLYYQYCAFSFLQKQGESWHLTAQNWYF